MREHNTCKKILTDNSKYLRISERSSTKDGSRPFGRRNAPNFKREGVMRLWTQYCRSKAIDNYKREQLLRLLQLQAIKKNPD